MKQIGSTLGGPMLAMLAMLYRHQGFFFFFLIFNLNISFLLLLLLQLAKRIGLDDIH